MESSGCARPGRAEYRASLYRAGLTSQGSRWRSIDFQDVVRDFALYDKIAGPFLPHDRQAKILDIGCGFGGFVAYLRKNGFARACGIDISDELVDAARRLGIAGVQQGDLRCFLSGATGEYALISAFDVIEHFDKEQVMEVLRRVHAALTAGGRMIICTPNAMSKYGRWCRYADFTHEHIFDANSIRQCLAATGFRNSKVLPLSPVIRGPASAARWLLWQVWEPMLKLSLAVESGWEKGQVFTPNLVAVAEK
jgi:2-polyprenyl-3-methyl-5-hydroxy-6-metoxy-1,4-benzoquinol methylase